MQNADLTEKKSWNIINLKKKVEILKPYIKMEKTIIKFGNNEIQKQKFHQHKRPISIKNTYINKIVVSNDFKGFKYCIGYKNSKNIEHLPIFLPKMRAYRRIW